jgi:hypothetical protein
METPPNSLLGSRWIAAPYSIREDKEKGLKKIPFFVFAPSHMNGR